MPSCVPGAAPSRLTEATFTPSSRSSDNRSSVSSGVTLGARATGTPQSRARATSTARSRRMSTSPPVSTRTGEGLPNAGSDSTSARPSSVESSPGTGTACGLPAGSAGAWRRVVGDKADPLVAGVAERLVLRVPAAAEHDSAPLRQHELDALGVDYAYRSFHLVRPVRPGLDRNLGHRSKVQVTPRPRKRPPSGTFRASRIRARGFCSCALWGYTRATVGLRICFVTPFAWSQPHEVNAHVADPE